jgi:hypothetical protein
MVVSAAARRAAIPVAHGPMSNGNLLLNDVAFKVQ